jgi:hypothetical protein
MQYALLIYTDPGYLDEQSSDEVETIKSEFAALLVDPRVVTGAQLEPVETATSVRLSQGRTLLTDGPFADTKEVLGGICIIDAPDLDQAIEMAKRIPALKVGGTVEIRPVVQR